MEAPDTILAAIQQQRELLEQAVKTKQAELAEAETKLSAFRASALAALGAASGSKSAQKQRAERQAVVASLVAEGYSRAEIVRRTDLPDHLVGYDIDCLRRRRPKQGTTKVFASSIDSTETEECSLDPAVMATNDDDTSASPYVPSEEDKPGQAGVVRAGCAASRDQLKAVTKEHQRANKKRVSFRTTVDNKHFHIADLDLMGDGETRKDETGHKHRICRFELLESDHMHGLTLQGD